MASSMHDMANEGSKRSTLAPYSPPQYFKWECNGFGRLFKIGGTELASRVIGEAGMNSLVVALFLTIRLPAFTDGAPDHATELKASVYIVL